ncbi:MAG: hypothetical protein J6125_03095, partial [Clostridia bacterium]|nr:hypothetical protein [Clostridia bacterium]
MYSKGQRKSKSKKVKNIRAQSLITDYARKITQKRSVSVFFSFFQKRKTTPAGEEKDHPRRGGKRSPPPGRKKIAPAGEEKDHPRRGGKRS